MKENRTLFLMLGAVIVLLVAANFYLNGSKSFASFIPKLPSTNQTSTPVPVVNTKQIKIGTVTLNIVIADNEQTRAKGLGGVTNLPQNQGMLFVFPTRNLSPDQAKFWMKD